MIADLPPWARQMLGEARVGRLGTADASGRPLVLPVCFDLEGEALYSAVDAKPKRVPGPALRRVRNIEANPRVALVVDDYDEDWRRLRYVLVEGRARLLEAGLEFTRAVERLTAKYPQYAAMDLARTASLVIAIAAERALAWRAA